MQTEKKTGGNPRRLTISTAFAKGLIAFGVIVCSIIVFFFFYRFDAVSNIVSSFFGYIAPITYGLAIAYMLNPLVCRFEKLFDKLFGKKSKKPLRAKKISKGLSIALSIIIALAAIIILIVMIIPSLVSSVTTLYDVLPKQFENIKEWISEQSNSDSAAAGLISTLIEKLDEWTKTDLFPRIMGAFDYVTSAISDTVTVLFNFIIGIVVAVYALCDKEKFVGQSKKLLYTVFHPRTVGKILDTARHTDNIFGGFLSGKIIDSIIVGIITFIVLSIMNMPYTLLVSVLVGVTNIIPFFGPFIGAIPSAFLIVLQDPLKGLYFIIFIIIMQQIDGNILGPKILGTTTGISEFWVTFALFLFGGWFGFVGMIIGVPLFAAIWYIVSSLINSRLKKKNMSVNSEDYLTVDKKSMIFDKPSDQNISESNDKQ